MQKGKFMNNSMFIKIIRTAALLMVIAVVPVILAGCGQGSGAVGSGSGAGDNGNGSAVSGDSEAAGDYGSETGANSGANSGANNGLSREANDGSSNGSASGEPATAGASGSATELEVRFGDDGEPFMMHLEDNETAAAIARHVGTTDWRLPIYDRDPDADYDVMQYYDISSRYDIPSNPETVTAQKAGEVYYSDPNRIILFYRDAEIPGEYTKVGTFDVTEEFVAAVEDNPILEGWGNKIVLIAQP